MRRTAALLLVLFGVYAATIGLHAFGSSDYAGDEPHYLLAAESLKRDHNVDVRDEYIARSYSHFYPYVLDKHGTLTEGRLNEPHGVGFPLIILPAYLIGGPKGVELFLAAIAALAVALAYRLALRVVPDPWAIGAAAVVGLSPPFLAYSTAIYPELTAGAALAGAALLALRLDARIRRGEAFLCFALLGLLPWLGTKFVPAGLAIAFIAARALWRSHRRTLTIGAVEVSLFSVALYVGINEALYGGVTPYNADDAGETATDAAFPGGYLNRAYRLVALFVDRNYGLLRWAPVFALAFAGLWWLWRSHREHLARAHRRARHRAHRRPLRRGPRGPALRGVVPRPHDVRLLVPAPPPNGGTPARRAAHRPRPAPRPAHRPRALRAHARERRLGLRGRALLGRRAVTGRPDAPFGPLTGLFPVFNNGDDWPFALAGAIAGVAVLLVLREIRHWRQTAGPTRARYSG